MKIKKWFFVVMAVVITFGIVLLAQHRKNDMSSITVTADASLESISDNDMTYIQETIYDGTNVMPKSLYSEPFGMTEYYVTNRSLAENITERTLEKMARSLEQDISNYYSVDYKNIDLSSLDIPESEVLRLQQIINDKSVITATFITDKSLIFQDNYRYYVRGILKIQEHSPETNETENIVTLPVTFDEDGNAIMAQESTDMIIIEEN